MLFYLSLISFALFITNNQRTGMCDVREFIQIMPCHDTHCHDHRTIELDSTWSHLMSESGDTQFTHPNLKEIAEGATSKLADAGEIEEDDYKILCVYNEL